MVSNPKAKGWITKHPNRGSGQPEIELRADGWERFRRAVAAAAKSGPKHRPSKHKSANAASVEVLEETEEPKDRGP
jgi:hypothetical protein